MARYIGPKDRLSRREGFDLFGTGAKLTRISVPPGMHGHKGLNLSTRYAKQLREKQKVKRMYGILEKQFKRYIEKALKTKGNTGEMLLSLLERRLDNVVFRAGFAPTRASARQLVSHRKVLVDGKKVNIPSYTVRVGEVVTLTPKAAEIPYIKSVLEEGRKVPSWLERKATSVKVKSLPKRDDVPEPISEQDIIEFYSR